MSETSETRGRCRREIAAAFEGTGFTANKEIWLLADALDRLAADVARIKEATLPQTTEERDCAIRERDEARAEVERLKAELAARPAAAWWLTERERRVLSSRSLHWADDVEPVFRSLLARAGSPPVVEVPELHAWDRHQREEAQCYRDALDAAGVQWKEVPRE